MKRGKTSASRRGRKAASGSYLDQLIPTRGYDHRVLRVRAESNARNPFSVALLSDGELAVAQGIPQLDCSVSRTGHDLSVVGREGNGENVVGVANESAGCGTGGELPETQGLVPRRRESVRSVGGNDLQRILVSSGERVHNIHGLESIRGVRTQSETIWPWPWRDRLG
jgi:hypothetical protein